MTNQYTFAFYNLENLFDTENDPKTLDDPYTKEGDLNWTKKRLNRKTQQLGKTISQLGFKETGHPPLLIGVAEIENSTVLDDLIHSDFLKNKNYGYVHYDSPDERGIDTALLYRRDYFEVVHSEAFTLLVNNPNGQRDYTRDILYVKGKINTSATLSNRASALNNPQHDEGLSNIDPVIHILVNHWPSRHDGPETTNYKRLIAAQRNRELINIITKENDNPRIVVMGDFNDNPQDKSLSLLADNDFYNPMKTLLNKYQGSLSHNKTWKLFDQILISNNLLKIEKNSLYYKTSKIYNVAELEEHNGKYQGNPMRTFIGTKYLGGNSDHFPVYIIFSYKKET